MLNMAANVRKTGNYEYLCKFEKDFADTIKVKIVESIVLIPVEIDGTTRQVTLLR